ncbi:MAG: dienelactone hydrolase family protein [Alphaproteobacteria bacterium]
MIAEPDDICFGPAGGGAPAALVLLLHGYGHTAAEMASHAPALARHLPEARFIAVNGFDPCPTWPIGRQWWPVGRRAADERPAAVATTLALLNQRADGWLKALGLSGHRLVVMGFSQGAILTLEFGLRRSVTPAALVSFSGKLLDDTRIAQDVATRPPVLALHGDLDRAVAVSRLAETEAALTALDVPVTARRIATLGHVMDEEGIAAAGRFAAVALAAPAVSR